MKICILQLLLLESDILHQAQVPSNFPVQYQHTDYRGNANLFP